MDAGFVPSGMISKKLLIMFADITFVDTAYYAY